MVPLRQIEADSNAQMVKTQTLDQLKTPQGNHIRFSQQIHHNHERKKVKHPDEKDGTRINLKTTTG